MLREILNSQDDIRKQIDIEANILKTKSNDDYYLVENSNQLQKVLDETLSSKALASTQKVNQALQKTIKSHNLVIDSNEKYDWKNFHECIEDITNHLEALVSSSKVVNKCEKKLESNATIEKNILDIVMKQLNLITTYIIQLVTNEEPRMLALRRKNATIEGAYDSHASLSWTTCYDNLC